MCLAPGGVSGYSFVLVCGPLYINKGDFSNSVPYLVNRKWLFVVLHVFGLAGKTVKMCRC